MPHNVQPEQESVSQAQIPAVQGETGSGAGTGQGHQQVQPAATAVSTEYE